MDASTKKAISGAVLVVRKADGTEITRYTTTTQAHVIKGLANGTYTIEEASAPAGYEVNKNKATFTINDEHRNIKVTIGNVAKKQAQSTVTITKVDANTKNILSGAVLVVRKANGVEVARFTTTNQAHVLKALANGTYTIEEVSAPVGYEVNKKVVKFTISDTNRNVKVTLENTAKKQVVVCITKVDANTKQALAGAVLVVRKANGTEIARFTTTTQAHILKDLAYGTYTIEEVSAPAGYLLNKNITQFTISETNRNIQITMENTPKNVMVSISKIDQATNSQLPGAVLVVKRADGRELVRFTTGTEAYILTDLEYGTYYVEEVSAPTGYVRNTEIASFTIDENHLSHQVTFVNVKEAIIPDTADTSSIVMLIIGIIISGTGLQFIRKNARA